MQRATEMSDDERWLALLIRHVCAPRWSIKTLALSSPSIMTIEKRLRMNEAHFLDEVGRMTRDIGHAQLMIKVGMRLGLGAREIMV